MVEKDLADGKIVFAFQVFFFLFQRPHGKKRNTSVTFNNFCILTDTFNKALIRNLMFSKFEIYLLYDIFVKNAVLRNLLSHFTGKPISEKNKFKNSSYKKASYLSSTFEKNF